MLFQHAEEDGEGAKKILNDPLFETIKPEYVFALHNLPGYKLGQVVVKNNTFSCAVNSMIISLSGKTSHAAEPEKESIPHLLFQKSQQFSIKKFKRIVLKIRFVSSLLSISTWAQKRMAFQQALVKFILL